MASLDDFIRHGMAALEDLPLVARSYLGVGKTPSLLREKVMLGVSGYNQCRYCISIHGALADMEGAGQEEQQALGAVCHSPLPEDLDPPTRLAVIYALRVITEEDPTDLMGELRRFFSSEEIREIAAFARVMLVSNEAGHTVDAFVERLKGAPREGSELAQELGILALLLPVGAPALGLYGLSRWYGRLGQEK